MSPHNIIVWDTTKRTTLPRFNLRSSSGTHLIARLFFYLERFRITSQYGDEPTGDTTLIQRRNNVVCPVGSLREACDILLYSTPHPQLSSKLHCYTRQIIPCEVIQQTRFPVFFRSLVSAIRCSARPYASICLLVKQADTAFWLCTAVCTCRFTQSEQMILQWSDVILFQGLIFLVSSHSPNIARACKEIHDLAITFLHKHEQNFLRTWWQNILLVCRMSWLTPNPLGATIIVYELNKATQSG